MAQKYGEFRFLDFLLSDTSFFFLIVDLNLKGVFNWKELCWNCVEKFLFDSFIYLFNQSFQRYS